LFELFQIWNLWKKYPLCPKKKYCNQNKYQINQNLVLRVWFALLNSRRNKLILEFWKFFEQLISSLSKISLVFVYLSKKLPKISFPNVKLSKSHANNLKKKNDEKSRKNIAPDVKKNLKKTLQKHSLNSLCVKLFFMGFFMGIPKIVVEKSIPSMCSPPNISKQK